MDDSALLAGRIDKYPLIRYQGVLRLVLHYPHSAMIIFWVVGSGNKTGNINLPSLQVKLQEVFYKETALVRRFALVICRNCEFAGYRTSYRIIISANYHSMIDSIIARFAKSIEKFLSSIMTEAIRRNSSTK
jgi:hypothetical protein